MVNNILTTPCYILHESMLNDSVAVLKQSFNRYWNHYCVGYSFKTNSLPWFVKKMKEEGFYAEVVSENEYQLALHMGFDKIIYNGPVKGKTTFFHALEHGAIINIDAKRELEWLQKHSPINAKIGLRVNFDLESLVPGETSAGTEGSRFGFSVENGEFENALHRLKQLNIPIAGIHLHVSSKTRSLAIYRELAKKACELKRKYNLSLEYVDLGGGYFGGLSNKPQFPDYLKVIREELLKEYNEKDTMLIMEPGTSLASSAFEYLTTVVDTKKTYANHIVVTDGSRIDVDPRFLKKGYFYQLHRKEKIDKPITDKQVITGFTCMEDDRLFVLQKEPELETGDQISFQNVGGYTMCLTPMFIRYLPRVYKENQGEYELIREAWGPEEYCQKSYY